MVHAISILLSAVALFTTSAQASLEHRAACNVDTYGPFKLYSVSSGPDGTSLINVVNMGLDDNNNTISTLTTCDTCGVTPVYWKLKKSVLSPVFKEPLVPGLVNASIETINFELPFGKVDVITGPKSSLTPYPIYCAQRNSTSKSLLPTILSANGHADKFSVCSWIGGRGPAHRRDIYYNQTSNVVASNCQNTTLVIELITSS